MLTDVEIGIGAGMPAKGRVAPGHALVGATEHTQRGHSYPKRLDPSA